LNLIFMVYNASKVLKIVLLIVMNEFFYLFSVNLFPYGIYCRG